MTILKTFVDVRTEAKLEAELKKGNFLSEIGEVFVNHSLL